MVRSLRERGVTIILTTHYIEEAEEMADRIGIINHGQLVLVEDKERLMRQLGKRRLTIQLQQPLTELPDALRSDALTLSEDRCALVYSFDAQSEQTGVSELLRELARQGIEIKDVNSSQSSLEDIFVGLVERSNQQQERI